MLQKWVRPDGVYFWADRWGVVVQEVRDLPAWDAFPKSLAYIRVPDEEGGPFADPPNSYSNEDFNRYWGLLPDWLQHEIIECFYEVNPSYREAVVG